MKIKPCPFKCPGQPELMTPIEIIRDFPMEGDEWGLMKIYVYCRKCGCKQREFSTPVSRVEDVKKYKEEAVRIWNERGE